MRNRVTSQNPYAWSLWLAGAMLPPILTRNPLYLFIELLATMRILSMGSEGSAQWKPLVKMAIWLVALSVPFNALVVHFGRIVLFTLPANWPVVGGKITLESILFGLSTGLALLTLFQAFAAFNVMVSPSSLLRLVPPFLFEAGLMIAIGLSFFPQMTKSISQVREVQQLRGHRFRKMGDVIPLVMPVLAIGIEKSLNLAESLASRGFGRHRKEVSGYQRLASSVITVFGLAVTTVGVAVGAFLPGRKQLALILVALGGVTMISLFLWQNSLVRRTGYTPVRWGWEEVVTAGAGAITAFVFVWIRMTSPQTLVYYPYPPFSPWPPFELIPAVAVFVLALPAMLEGMP